MTFNPLYFYIDFNWFLICLDFKSFMHFILLFCFFLNYGKKKKLIVYAAEQKLQV